MAQMSKTDTRKTASSLESFQDYTCSKKNISPQNKCGLCPYIWVLLQQAEHAYRNVQSVCTYDALFLEFLE